MYTLSVTSIGLRPIEECEWLYLNLKDKLNLKGFEIAVGCLVDIEKVFDSNLNIYLHDRCLYKNVNGVKRRLNFLDPSTHNDIAYFISRNKVQAISYHSSIKDSSTLKEFDAAIDLLSFNLNIPVWVETMINSNYHYGDIESIGKHSLLVDISHINIWAKGDHKITEQIVLNLINTYGCKIKQIHLSHNNGRKDSHELIPTDIWFKKYLNDWTTKYVITYESLPVEYAEYERLDKKGLINKLNERTTDAGYRQRYKFN